MTDFAQLYERLNKDQARLKEELKQMQPSSERREGTPFGKREEEANEAFEFEKRLAIEKQLIGTLTEIEYALKKYEDGTYGTCDNCGQLIEPARLEALPQANLCLNCKSLQIKHVRSK